MAELRGDIFQVPAAVSAIKIDGVRSYASPVLVRPWIRSHADGSVSTLR